MKPSDSILNLMSQFEGNRLTAYTDSGGIWTIGRGHTGDVYKDEIITQEQSDEYFRQDVEEKTAQLNDLGLNFRQGQFDSLTSLIFNCGFGRVKQTGLFEILKENINNESDVIYIFMQITHDAKGNLLQGLVVRRFKELYIYFS
jgi:lysozyme